MGAALVSPCVPANVSHCSTLANLPCSPNEETRDMIFAPALLESDILPGSTTFRESQAASRQKAGEYIQSQGQNLLEKPRHEHIRNLDARCAEAMRCKQAEKEVELKRLAVQQEQDRRRDLEALEAEATRRRLVERDEESWKRKKTQEEELAERIKVRQELAEQAIWHVDFLAAQHAKAEEVEELPTDQQLESKWQRAYLAHQARIEEQAAKRKREREQEAGLKKEAVAQSAFHEVPAENAQCQGEEKRATFVCSEQNQPTDRGASVVGVNASDVVEDNVLEGFWNRGEVRGNMMRWQIGGGLSELKVMAARHVALKLRGKWFLGELRADGKIHWEDGDVWNRL